MRPKRKVEYLCNAVLLHKYAFTALNKCYAEGEPWSSTPLSQALHSAWLQKSSLNRQIKPILPQNNNESPEIIWETQR